MDMQLFWNRQRESEWRAKLGQLLGYYQCRIFDENARRKAAKRFDNALDHAIRVTWVLYACMDEQGLWQVAINFACLASGFPPSGRVDVDVAISFCNKFEMALEILRRKSYEFMSEVELEDYDENAYGKIEDWLIRQRLNSVEEGNSQVEDIIQKIRALMEAPSFSGNIEEALNKTLFMHINLPIRHPDHMSWWIQSLRWFHKALMVEGEGVQSEATTSKFSFRDSSHLVLHAVKHGAQMSLKSIEGYYRDAVITRENYRAAGITRGNKTEIITPHRPPRKLAFLQESENQNVIKTYHVMTTDDSGKWPYGPYDILKAERLDNFVGD